MNRATCAIADDAVPDVDACPRGRRSDGDTVLADLTDEAVLDVHLGSRKDIDAVGADDRSRAVDGNVPARSPRRWQRH